MMIKAEPEDTLHDVCLVMIYPLLYGDSTIINKANCCNLLQPTFPICHV